MVNLVLSDSISCGSRLGDNLSTCSRCFRDFTTIQPTEKDDCFISVAALLLNLPKWELKDFWPDWKNGVSDQALVILGLQMNVPLVTLHNKETVEKKSGVIIEETDIRRFLTPSVRAAATFTKAGGNRHMVYWNGHRFIDPAGDIYSACKIEIAYLKIISK